MFFPAALVSTSPPQELHTPSSQFPYPQKVVDQQLVPGAPEDEEVKVLNGDDVVVQGVVHDHGGDVHVHSGQHIREELATICPSSPI